MLVLKEGTLGGTHGSGAHTSGAKGWLWGVLMQPLLWGPHCWSLFGSPYIQHKISPTHTPPLLQGHKSQGTSMERQRRNRIWYAFRSSLHAGNLAGPGYLEQYRRLELITPSWPKQQYISLVGSPCLGSKPLKNP